MNSKIFFLPAILFIFLFISGCVAPSRAKIIVTPELEDECCRECLFAFIEDKSLPHGSTKQCGDYSKQLLLPNDPGLGVGLSNNCAEYFNEKPSTVNSCPFKAE